MENHFQEQFPFRPFMSLFFQINNNNNNNNNRIEKKMRSSSRRYMFWNSSPSLQTLTKQRRRCKVLYRRYVLQTSLPSLPKNINRMEKKIQIIKRRHSCGLYLLPFLHTHMHMHMRDQSFFMSLHWFKQKKKKHTRRQNGFFVSLFQFKLKNTHTH